MPPVALLRRGRRQSGSDRPPCEAKKARCRECCPAESRALLTLSPRRSVARLSLPRCPSTAKRDPRLCAPASRQVCLCRAAPKRSRVDARIQHQERPRHREGNGARSAVFSPFSSPKRELKATRTIYKTAPPRTSVNKGGEKGWSPRFAHSRLLRPLRRLGGGPASSWPPPSCCAPPAACRWRAGAA
jgi:hypothetical protein